MTFNRGRTLSLVQRKKKELSVQDLDASFDKGFAVGKRCGRETQQMSDVGLFRSLIEEMVCETDMERLREAVVALESEMICVEHRNSSDVDC